MKTLFLFGIFFWLVSFAMADEILHEGFDTGFPPEGWSVETTHEGVTPSGYSYTWQPDMYYFHDGIFSAFVYGAMDGEPQDELIVSPAIDLSGYSSASVTFWTYGYDWEDGLTDLTFEVRSGTTPDSTWVVLWYYPNIVYTWESQTVDLSEYVGQTIHIGWRYAFSVSVGDERGDIINLDDITLTGTPDDDDDNDDDNNNDVSDDDTTQNPEKEDEDDDKEDSCCG